MHVCNIDCIIQYAISRSSVKFMIIIMVQCAVKYTCFDYFEGVPGPPAMAARHIITCYNSTQTGPAVSVSTPNVICNY